eukprot:gb/GEZN01021865.1/.p1 GENE.gb/GEZN01021865.1/~~gb/GEZN01021865.1/.p1  ORF type:complete len:155 (+),score=10.93 gb/GEZN01021865.1/:156-620(+)
MLSLLGSLAFGMSEGQSLQVHATTAKYTGNMTNWNYDLNGYDNALAACQQEFPASHVCSSHELGVLAQLNQLLPLGSTVRFASMIFTPVESYQMSSTDCYGFTSSLNGNFSQCVFEQTSPPGPLLPQVCDCKSKLSLACCIIVPKTPKPDILIN